MDYRGSGLEGQAVGTDVERRIQEMGMSYVLVVVVDVVERQYLLVKSFIQQQ